MLSTPAFSMPTAFQRHRIQLCILRAVHCKAPACGTSQCWKAREGLQLALKILKCLGVWIIFGFSKKCLEPYFLILVRVGCWGVRAGYLVLNLATVAGADHEMRCGYPQNQLGIPDFCNGKLHLLLTFKALHHWRHRLICLKGWRLLSGVALWSWQKLDHFMYRSRMIEIQNDETMDFWHSTFLHSALGVLQLYCM